MNKEMERQIQINLRPKSIHISQNRKIIKIMQLKMRIWKGQILRVHIELKVIKWMEKVFIAEKRRLEYNHQRNIQTKCLKLLFLKIPFIDKLT